MFQRLYSARYTPHNPAEETIALAQRAGEDEGSHARHAVPNTRGGSATSKSPSGRMTASTGNFTPPPPRPSDTRTAISGKTAQATARSTCFVWPSHPRNQRGNTPMRQEPRVTLIKYRASSPLTTMRDAMARIRRNTSPPAKERLLPAACPLGWEQDRGKLRTYP